MSVLVTDTRTVISEADANVGGTWTSITAGGAFTTPFVESTAAWVGTLNIDTGQMYFDLTTPLSAVNQMIYVWSNNFALQSVWTATNPPNAMYLSDGTNHISFKLAGSDKKEFSHLSSQDWNWDCLLLDMDKAAEWNSLGYTTIRGGSFAAFNSASVDRFGADMTTLSKGLGGGTNVAVDIIRMGNNGLRITSGSAADPGKFLQIVVEDRSTGNLKAHGIIREYTTGIYGIQGPLTFGTSSTAGSYFQDSNITLAFENRVVANNKYFLSVTGSATANTTFILRNSSITTAGPYVKCDFSGSANAFIRKLEITGCSFSNLGNPIYFSRNLSGSFHTASQNSFAGCGIIDAGSVLFQDNTITTGKNPSGSLLLNTGSATDNMSNLSFIASGTVGHAIYITAAATYSFDNFNYSGFGADGAVNAVVYNNSAGAVLINVIGGDTPTYRNGAGATTTLSSPATLTLTGMVSGTEVTITSGSPEVVLYHLESVDNDGVAEYSYTDTAGKIVDILVFHINYDPNLSSILNYTLLTEDATIPIQQITDRIYSNPAGP